MCVCGGGGGGGAAPLSLFLLPTHSLLGASGWGGILVLLYRQKIMNFVHRSVKYVPCESSGSW